MEVRKMKRFTKAFVALLAVALVSGIAWAHEAPATAPSTQEQVAPMSPATPPAQVQQFNRAPHMQGQQFNQTPHMQGQQFNQTPPSQGQVLDAPYTAPDGYYCSHRWGRFAPGHRARCYNTWYSNARSDGAWHSNAMPSDYSGYQAGHGCGGGGGCW